MSCLGVICFLQAVVLLLVNYTKTLSVQFTFLCLQYLLFYIIRVLMFVVITMFTPAFTMKSSVSENLTISICGVNRKGIEIFRFDICDDSSATLRTESVASSVLLEEETNRLNLSYE